MSELAIRQDTTTPALGTAGANLIREAAAVMVDAHALAKAVCNTKMIPKHFQGNPDECAAAMLYGASLGLDPMQSVRQIYVVHGQAALYARAMVSLVLGAGHSVWTAESTDSSVTVAAQRKGSQHVEQATWTYDRAKKAGYTNNEKYRTDPQAMLYSKAASEVCRKVAPDVLSGVYAVEELQMERFDDRPAPTAQRPVAAADRMGAILGTTTAEQVHDEPAPEPEPAGEPETGETITSSQLKMLGALMREVGLTERPAALAYVADVIGREVDSRNDLTKSEASAVIDALNADKDPQ